MLLDMFPRLAGGTDRLRRSKKSRLASPVSSDALTLPEFRNWRARFCPNSVSFQLDERNVEEDKTVVISRGPLS